MAPYNGQVGPHELPPLWGRNESGPYYHRRYEGRLAEMRQLAAQYDALGMHYDFEESFGKATLTVRMDSNPATTIEAPVDQWEYIGGRAEVDILEADVPSGITATLSQNNIGIIRSAIQNPPDGSDTSGAYSAKDRPNAAVAQSCFTDGNPANAFTIYKLMQAGVRSVRARNPTLRHTRTVTNTWTIPVALTNVGRVISTSSMVSLEGVPSGLLFNLPNLVPASFQTIAVAYGWLKLDANVQQIVGRKWQLVQEWEYGLWATAPYLAPL